MKAFITQFLFSFLLAVLSFVFAKKGNWTDGRKALFATGIFFLAMFASTFIPLSDENKVEHWVVAGTVEDEDSRDGVGQAYVSLEGIDSPSMSEDNGNFRIELHGKMRVSKPLRIKVTKNGYKPVEETVTPPTDNCIVLLPKQ
jgi:hypothetical protein